MQTPRLREKAILVLTILTLIASFVITFVNRRDTTLALQNAAAFTALACLVMIVLHVGALLAERKGYSTLLGVLLVALLNVVGLIILLILPNRLALRNGERGT